MLFLMPTAARKSLIYCFRKTKNSIIRKFVVPNNESSIIKNRCELLHILIKSR